ncbi:MAG TPA: TIM barrel protein [Candidatus Acidoferrum sp.]|nr:TIM barrel protein [Candidatus Acidoferrum sp.]
MMNRREFGRSIAGVAAGAAAGSLTSAMPLAQSTQGKDGGGGVAPFKLSVMLWTVFRGQPFAERLDKIAEAGFHAVELVDEFKGWTKQDFGAARRKKQELGLEFDATAGVWHTLADAGDRDAFLQNVREFITTMKELECTRLVLQTGNAVPGLSPLAMRANCLETLKRGGDIAAQNGIELLVENIDPEENPKYFLTSSADGFEIVRTVGNPHVKFLYDFFHEQIAEGNLIAKLGKNMDLIGLVHVADVPGRHEPGTGEIHYPNIYRKLGELGYDRYVAMEFLPTSEPVAALRAARETALKFGAAQRKQSSNESHSRRSYATA